MYLRVYQSTVLSVDNSKITDQFWMKSCKVRYTWMRTPGGATWLKPLPGTRCLEQAGATKPLPGTSSHRSCLSFLLSQCYLEFLLELHAKSFHSVIINHINILPYLINQLGIKWTLSRRSDLATISWSDPDPPRPAEDQEGISNGELVTIRSAVKATWSSIWWPSC